MREIRLLDPNGYTVPGTAHTLPDGQINAMETYLRTAAARADLLAHGITSNGRRRPGYHLSAYRVQTTPAGVECVGCHREKDDAFLHQMWVPTGKTCPLHQIAPAEAVVARLRAAAPRRYSAPADVTITVDRRGEITISYVATRATSREAAEDLWVAWAKLCGIPADPNRRSASDSQVKARVAHGWVDPGMTSEYRRGVPTRLVAHGWADMVTREEKREAELEEFLASLPPRTVPSRGTVPGYTILPIRQGAVLPDGETVACVEDPLGSAWLVTTESGGQRYIHKHAELRHYTSGRVGLVEPEWAGCSSD